MTAEWIKLHSPPRQRDGYVAVISSELTANDFKLSPRDAYRLKRSQERWERRPEAERVRGMMRGALLQGQLGRIEGMTIHTSPLLPTPSPLVNHYRNTLNHRSKR